MAHPQDDTDNEAPSPVARRGNAADSSDDEGVAPVEGAPGAAAAAPGAEGAASDVPMSDASEGAAGAAGEKKEVEREVHTWRIPLQKWRNENRDREYSPDFKLDGENWRILIFPKGNPNHSVQGCMAAYLELKSERAYYSTVCHFKMQMAHPTELNKYAWRDSTHTFTNNEVDRGFNDLLTPSNLADYTHDDGCVVLNVQAYKAPPGFQMRASSYETYTPYDSKSSTGFCGLLNQGATCYMNSMLQALFLLPKFREVVYQIPSEADDRGAKIGFALQRVFHALQTGSRGVSTKQLTGSFGWGSIDAFMQHDVQEFCRVLLDSLDTTTKKTALGGVIASLFEGKSQAYIQCINVDFKSQRDETYWDLSINVKGCKTLTDSFAQYVEEEVLDGDNKYRAEGHGLQAARKGTRFISLPPILQLQLKRFEYDPMRDQMVKINDRFEFPTEVDLTRFEREGKNEAGEPQTEPVLYCLHSVLVHSGGVHGGHYYSYIRPFMASVPYADCPWYKFDDETVTEVKLEDAVAGNYGGEAPAPKFKGGYWGAGMGGRVSTTSAYMLIYVRKSAIQSLVAPNAGSIPAPVADPAAAQEPAAKDAAKVEGEEDKKKAAVVADGDKKKELPVQYPVPIPESLSLRFKSEEVAEKERQEARKKAAMYMDLRFYSEAVMRDRSPVGIDFQRETYDPHTGFLGYSSDSLESSIKVLRKATLLEIAPMIAEKYGIPPERQELWIINPRSQVDCPRPAIRMEPRGMHAGLSVEDIVKDLSTSHVHSPIFLRDTAADPRPVPAETPRLTATVPGVEPVAPLCPVPAAGALTTKNSLLILFKFWDVPSQKMMFLGSAHFAHSEPVQAIREYCAELLKKHSADKKAEAAAAAAAAGGDVDALSASLSSLSIANNIAANLTAADLWTGFEVNGSNAKHFPFNFSTPPSDPDLLKHYKEGPDWHTITTEGCKITNGEMCIFHIKYGPVQMQQFREAYEGKYRVFAQEHLSAGSKPEPAAPAAAAAAPAGAASAAAAPAAAAQIITPYKSKFSDSCTAALEYFAWRQVIEFRAMPYKAPPSGAAGMTTHGEAPVAAVAPTVYTPRPGILTLELLRTESYADMMSALGHCVNLDPQRIKLYKPSIMNDDVPDSQFVKTTYMLDLNNASVGDVMGYSRMRDPASILYYSIMEYTWKELEKSVPVVINYNDKHLTLWTFQTLVPKTARFKDLGPLAFNKVEELKAAADPSYVIPSAPVVPSMHYFAIDFRQTVRELSLEGSVTELKDYLVNGQFNVNCMEDTEEELQFRARPTHGARIIWVRRYYPLGGVYWRPAGVPFTFLAKEAESIVDFRARLQARLNYDDAKMKLIDVAVLTQHEHKPITKDTDQPWALIADDLRGVWTCLGLYDPVVKKGTAASTTGNPASFKPSYNGAVKFNP